MNIKVTLFFLALSAPPIFAEDTAHCGPKRRAPYHKAEFLVTPLVKIQTGYQYDCCASPENYKAVRFDGVVGGSTNGSVGGRTMSMTWRLSNPELIYSDAAKVLFPGNSSTRLLYWWNFRQEAVATLEVTTNDNFALNKLISLSLPVRKGISVPIEVAFGNSLTTQTSIIVFTNAASSPFPCD